MRNILRIHFPKGFSVWLPELQLEMERRKSAPLGTEAQLYRQRSLQIRHSELAKTSRIWIVAKPSNFSVSSSEATGAIPDGWRITVAPWDPAWAELGCTTHKVEFSRHSGVVDEPDLRIPQSVWTNRPTSHAQLTLASATSSTARVRAAALPPRHSHVQPVSTLFIRVSGMRRAMSAPERTNCDVLIISILFLLRTQGSAMSQGLTSQLLTATSPSRRPGEDGVNMRGNPA